MVGSLRQSKLMGTIVSCPGDFVRSDTGITCEHKVEELEAPDIRTHPT
jgi:hypothetical protein